MKLIVAFIRPEHLPQVRQELYSRDINSMTVTNVMGSGRQKGYTSSWRGAVEEGHLLPKVRLEIGVAEAQLEAVFDALKAGAATGTAGDGVVFVLEVARSLRLSTGDEVA
jgi:nitrogen regulatory protein P-II 1